MNATETWATERLIDALAERQRLVSDMLDEGYVSLHEIAPNIWMDPAEFKRLFSGREVHQHFTSRGERILSGRHLDFEFVTNDGVGEVCERDHPRDDAGNVISGQETVGAGESA